MNKTAQTLAWNCLPLEVKKEVKRLYKTRRNKRLNEVSSDFIYCLVYLFGKHNLSSDAEGEEMLTVSRKRVQEIYSYNEEILSQDPTHRGAILLKKKLIDLFGSKCLPDDSSKLQASCRQVKKPNDTIDGTIEPKPAEPNPDGDNLSPEPKPANRTPSSYTQPVTDCHQIDRLQIAAMAMQGLLSNADRMKMYEDIASYPPFDNLTRIVARNALRYADALIAETQKGGEK